MSKGKRNVAFGNDEDLEIEYVSKESTAHDNNAQASREVVIDSLETQNMRASSRQEAITGELNDLARESPETVAAIIKSMFRGDN